MHCFMSLVFLFSVYEEICNVCLISLFCDLVYLFLLLNPIICGLCGLSLPVLFKDVQLKRMDI